MNAVSCSATRGLWAVLPLFLFPTVLLAQGGASLEFDSAVDSHRRLNDERAPMPGADAQSTIDSDDPHVGSDVMSSRAESQSGAKPAGDRPEPVDPMRTMAPESNEQRPASSAQPADLHHDSVLTDHNRYKDSKSPLWKEANERVGEIGGWREYAKELYTPAPTNAVQPAGDRPEPDEPAHAIAPNDRESVPERSVPRATLDYDSVLADYTEYEESDGPNWIKANERVGEIGGWREYAKELFEPASSASDEGVNP